MCRANRLQFLDYDYDNDDDDEKSHQLSFGSQFAFAWANVIACTCTEPGNYSSTSYSKEVTETLCRKLHLKVTLLAKHVYLTKRT